MGQFFEELKRRNVLRVAAAYVVVSWLIIQVVETIFPVFGFGDAGIRLVIIVLAIGLIPALILSWAFEITPEGLKKEKDVDRSQSDTAHTGKKLDRWIMVVLVLALGYFAIDKFALSPQREVAQQQQQAEQLASATEEARQEGRSQALTESYGDKSIAVLPFADMSPMHDQEYMSDGIAEELLNLLVKIPELRVISRTSAFAFKGKDIDIPTIGEQLNVAHILEGSVRKAGNRIRITAQLIEARSDTHLWSETYDRVLDDIFAIQDEISAAITSALKIQLLGSSKPANSETIGVEAYDTYLKGLRGLRVTSVESLEEAIIQFETVINMENEFLPAYTKLAEVLWNQVWIGSAPAEPTLTRAEGVARGALTINSEFGAAHAALGLVASTRGELDASIDHFEQAIEFGESSPEVYVWLALALSQKGQYERANVLFDRAIGLDPLNWLTHFFRGDMRYMQGRLNDAYESYERVAEVEPENPAGPGLMGMVAGYGLGDIAETTRSLSQAIGLEARDAELPAIMALAYLAIGDGDGASAMADRAMELGANYGYVAHTKVVQLISAGQSDLALELASRVLAEPDVLHRRGSKVNLEASTAGIHMMRGEFTEAENFLLQQYPDITSLLNIEQAQEIKDLGPADTNVIVVQMLANIYRLTDRADDADRLVEHLAIVGPDNVHLVYEHAVQLYDGVREQLRPDDHWILAVAGLGREDVETTLDHLEQAAKGFLLDWQFHFVDHPALWSLRDHPRYQAIIEGIEAKMAEQRQALIAGTADR